MQPTLAQQPLNPAQIHFLQTLQFVKTDEMMQELQQVVSDFYFKKMEEEADKWWDENNMTDRRLQEMFHNSHYRTTYK
ncbi:MAG: hypothetical protein LBE91_04375 [Tannerella sp.]|jgi:hypothetical protein|nr:hypothetical protein [Tannerella sp.]